MKLKTPKDFYQLLEDKLGEDKSEPKDKKKSSKMKNNPPKKDEVGLKKGKQ